MKKLFFSCSFLCIMFFSSMTMLTAEPIDVNAGSIRIRGEEESSIAETRDMDGDYLWGGYQIDFSGSSDDLYLMGRDIEFAGSSRGSLTAFGDSVNVGGQVGNNLHGAGRNVRITGRINDTALVAGENITVGESAVVEGTFLSASSTLHILGELRDGLISGAGEIIIDGAVKGDVNIHTAKLIITERGSIDGNLTYSANTLLSEDELSRISGKVVFEEYKEIEKDKFSAFRIIAFLLFFAALAATGLLLLLLPVFRGIMTEERDFASCGKTALWGLIPLFIYPVAVILTIPLFPLSIALILAIFPLWLLTIALGLSIAGQMLFKVFGWEKENRFLYFLLAFGIFIPISLIPFLGFLISLGVIALGAGQLIRSTFNTKW